MANFIPKTKATYSQPHIINGKTCIVIFVYGEVTFKLSHFALLGSVAGEV